MNILDGKSFAGRIKDDIKLALKQDMFAHNTPSPKLAIVIVGQNPASLVYVANKIKSCDFVGIKTDLYQFDYGVKEETLCAKILELNADNSTNGIIVQLPLPSHIDAQKVVDFISPEKDVDGLTSINLGKLVSGNKTAILGCTPSGVIALLKEYDINMVGKNVVIINRSLLVGKPLALAFLSEHSTVTVCHSKTQNLNDITKNADIIVVGVGKINFLTNEMVKAGAVIIDVGINRNEQTGKLQGDVDFENVAKKASYITPVPNGIGPMTVAYLIKNTFDCFINQNKKHQ